MSRSKRFLPRSARLALRRKKQQRITASETSQGDSLPSPEMDARRPSDDPIFDWSPSSDKGDTQKRVSFWQRVQNVFRKSPTVPPQGKAAPSPSEDPLREILSIPKGPARLDAFQNKLQEIPVGTPGHRAVSLGFHQELCAMAKRMDVDLRLLADRVEKCAEGLSHAGEKERAGELYALLGQDNRAAELFIDSGAIEKLQASHEKLEERSGSGSFEAQIAFKNAQTEFAANRRQQGFALLQQACAEAPENHAYRAALDLWAGRQITDGRLHLRLQARQITIRHQWPLILGRGDESVIELKDPRISRQHLEITYLDNQCALGPLQSPSLVVCDSSVVESITPIGGAGLIQCGSIRIDYRVGQQALYLSTSSTPNHIYVCMFNSTVELDVDSGEEPQRPGSDSLAIRATPLDGFSLQPNPTVSLDGISVTEETMLLHGDSLAHANSLIQID